MCDEKENVAGRTFKRKNSKEKQEHLGKGSLSRYSIYTCLHTYKYIDIWNHIYKKTQNTRRIHVVSQAYESSSFTSTHVLLLLFAYRRRAATPLLLPLPIPFRVLHTKTTANKNIILHNAMLTLPRAACPSPILHTQRNQTTRIHYQVRPHTYLSIYINLQMYTRTYIYM